MPIEKVSGTSLEYYLICFDKAGKERPENGELLSEKVLHVLSSQPITDVFLMSHGWQGDVPSAKNQYQKWIAAMATTSDDIQKIQQIRPGFSPLLIGLHWPSQVWGNENLDAQLPSFDIAGDPQLDDLIEDYAGQVSDTEASRDALRRIFNASIEYNTPPDTLPPEVLAAYEVLIREASFANDSEETDEWQETETLSFDPESIYEDDLEKQTSDVSFGIGSHFASTRNLFLNVPRLLSFWKMKDLARKIGETSGFNLLTKLQQVANHQVRFHLMGHSFGTIVVSASVAGTKDNNKLVRPINSLVLIQGAVSLWSYSSNVPHRNNLSGYFHPIIAEGKVAGPIVTTQSDLDHAVRNAYPIAGTIGLTLDQDIDFDVSTRKYPDVGGIGVYGIQGEGLDITNIEMLSLAESYNFQPGKIYNLESTKYISVENPDLFSGAHNAIDKPEVAHAFWSAVLSV